MNNKKNKFSVLLVLLAMIVAFVGASIFSISVPENAVAMAKQLAYQQTVNHLAQNVGFESNYQNFYEQQQPVTVYNFAIVVRFKDEVESFNTTYFQMLDQMYNAQDNYSVNKYYKTVSNGLLDLQTVFVTPTTSSYQTQKPRSTYVNAEHNGGVGYDPNKMISDFLPPYIQLPLDLETSYILEYELLGELYQYSITTKINTPEYRTAADSDNNGTIDCLSIILLPDPNNYVIDWGDLLWAHSSEVQMDLIEDYGTYVSIFLEYDISAADFKYTYASKTYKAGNYMMTDLEVDNMDPRTGLPSNNTDIHELGHVLGWPDYYIYDTTFPNTSSDNETEPVGVWDIMAYSHLDSPQYPTSYTRLVKGWMPQNSITPITENGIYTLKPVNYEEFTGTEYDGRTIAYKIQHPQNPYQSIWFEYRHQHENSFENNESCLGQSLLNGLLVYRVDEGFASAEIMGQSFGTTPVGNFAAAPFNLYIFRNEIPDYSEFFKNFKAPLNEENKSMGDGKEYTVEGRPTTATKITWQVYDGDPSTPQSEIPASSVQFVDSGIKVEIVSMNNYELSFKITYDQFPEPTAVERTDFANQNLYNHLLTLAGKNTNQKLSVNDFNNFTTIDLSNLSISSIKGMEKLNLSSLVALNLNFNNLTFSTFSYVEQLINENSNLVVSLVGNSFNLVSMSATHLQNPRLIWGFQKNLYENTHYVFNNTNFSRDFYWSSEYANHFEMHINGTKYVANNVPSLVQYYNFSNYGQYVIEFVPTQSGKFVQNNNTQIKVTIIRLALPNNFVERNSAFPPLIVEGIEPSELTITRYPINIDTSTTGEISVFWNVSVNAKPSANTSISGDFEIVDTTAPVITLLEPLVVEIELGQDIATIIESLQIEITDNNQQVSYPFASNPSGQVGFWTMSLFKVSGGNYTLVADFNSITFGEYAIRYYATDEYGNTSDWVHRTLFVTAQEIEQTQFSDPSLYSALQALVGTNKLYQNSLENLDYVDLSNQNINSAQGLQFFTYKQGAVIDLSNNHIMTLDGIDAMILDDNISKIILLFNLLAGDNFPLEEKLVYGVQGVDQDLFIPDMPHPYWFAIGTELYVYNANDHESDFELSSSFELLPSWNTLIEYGTYTITYSSQHYQSQSKTFTFGNVWEVDQSPSFDYPASISAYDLIVLQGLTLEQVDMKFYVGEVEFDPKEKTFGDQVGMQTITIDVYYGDQRLKSLTIMITINDNEAPQVFIHGAQNIYLFVGDEYIEYGYYATDNYLAEPFVEVLGEVNTQNPGVYYITYRAFDNHNYSDEIKRIVHVGTVAPKQNVKVDVKRRLPEQDMLDFVVFSKNDFNYEVIQSYNQNVLGSYTVSITITHKQDSNLSTDIDIQVQVVDRIAPVLRLYGPSLIYMYVGDIYEESGALVEDNYDAPRDVGSVSDTFNPNQIGTYTIVYSATDSQGNMAQSIHRTVHVIPKPFSPLTVVLESGQSSLYAGNVVRFKADISEYDQTKYDYNSIFIWYVNGVEVKRANDITLAYAFEQTGTQRVEVRVLNMNLQGEYVVQSGIEYQFVISEGGFLERFGVPILIATSAVIVVAIFWSLIARKRRKFYL